MLHTHIQTQTHTCTHQVLISFDTRHLPIITWPLFHIRCQQKHDSLKLTIIVYNCD